YIKNTDKDLALAVRARKHFCKNAYEVHCVVPFVQRNTANPESKDCVPSFVSCSCASAYFDFLPVGRQVAQYQR
ncbi:MAG: hypothetical protein IJR50_06995, partial [Treponema sp.]|nr:hypothetical protein [Treponema sp.]